MNINIWQCDTSQAKYMEQLNKVIEQFLRAANEKEPDVIHQVVFEDFEDD